SSDHDATVRGSSDPICRSEDRRPKGRDLKISASEKAQREGSSFRRDRRVPSPRRREKYSSQLQLHIAHYRKVIRIMHLLGLKCKDLKGLIGHDIIYPQREIIEVKAPSKAIPLLLERIVEPLSPDLPVD